VRFYGIDKSVAGSISGGIAVMVLVGAPIGGIIADKWSLKYKNAKLLFSAITTFISSISLFIAVFTENFTTSLFAFGIFGITTVAYLAPATAVIQEVVHSGLRAIAFGVNVMFMNIFGAFSAPILVGVISDYYSANGAGLKFALNTLPALGIIATITFLITKKAYLKDLSRNL